MSSEEYAIMLIEDRNLSEVDIINLSGLLQNMSIDDIPGIVHSIEVLRQEPGYARELARGLQNG